MKTLRFKCTLLSDVILNQKAASEGANNTLDFIPGSNFLGIVAAKYNDFGDNAMEVFHSGKVRFGDAHPVCKGHDGIRTLRVPASMYHPKLGKASEVCYIHHEYDRKKVRASTLLRTAQDSRPRPPLTSRLSRHTIVRHAAPRIAKCSGTRP